MTRQLQYFALVLLTTGLVANLAPLASAAISFSGDVSISGTTIIGNMGFGTFRIDGGSTHSTLTSNVTIGSQTSGVGFATVTGAGSLWAMNSSSGMTVGASGLGRLEILDGGAVNFQQFGSGITIASSSSSHGTVVVDGAGSLLNTNAIFLGQNTSNGGDALLQISNGAIVNTSSGSSSFTTWAGGRVSLDDGLLRVGSVMHNGTIAGSGEVFVTSTSGFTNNGRIEAGPGDVLRINGSMFSVQNQGIIAADGATLEFQRAITGGFSGDPEITLRNSLLRVGTLVTSTAQPQLTNTDLLAATGGVNDLYGRVLNENNGRIAVTNQSTLIFHDWVVAESGTIVVFPGSSAVFLDDLTVEEGATLLADLAGTNEDIGFGQIEVVGNAVLAGSLDITLATGYSPQLGDSYPILAAGRIVGDLALGDVPSLPSGLAWDLDTDANHVVLSVVPSPAGDYNQNGIVDIADYVLWRHTENQTGNELQADGNNSGSVSDLDYDFWSERYDNSAPGQAATAAVPEPTSAAVLCCGMIFLLTTRRQLQ